MFEMYLKRRADRPDEDVSLAYAEIYGRVVFEDSKCSRVNEQGNDPSLPDPTGRVPTDEGTPT